jgi:nitrile hydratase accessory protein
VRVTVELTGDAAPPRRNGELVFDAPWEARAFGLAAALASEGVCAWDDFRARLVEEIAAHEEPYYASWLGSLERLVVERGLLAPDEIAARVAELEHADSHDHG